MAEIDKDSIALPARIIPAPTTISQAARATLAAGSPLTSIILSDSEPDPHDVAAWRQLLGERERLVTPLLARAAQVFPWDLETLRLRSCDLFALTPKHVDVDVADAALFYLHPGSYTSCRGINAANMAMPTATKLGMRTFALDYRMPPDHPFPAALDDAVDAYQVLLREYGPERLVVLGRSAGGGLAAAMLLKAQHKGLAMPSACVLQTPEADLTESGDSFETNIGIDNFLRRLTNSIALYADGQDLTNPYLSPLFGDYDAGFPPTILTSGTRDLFLSNTVLLHRKLRNAGVEAELHVWEAMGHGGFFGAAPEDEDVWRELLRFVRRHLNGQCQDRRDPA